MNYKINIKSNSEETKHSQIAKKLRTDIEKGILKIGTKLPSINAFSKDNNVARDTIEKAYRALKKEGYILSTPGKGNYVASGSKKTLKILMVLNKMSSYKKEVYEAFINTLGTAAKVDLQIHHYNLDFFKEIIDANKGKYHYYAVMPHFFYDTPRASYLKVLKRIPNTELVVLDKKVELDKKIINVFQDFEQDIFDGLLLEKEMLNKYDSFKLVFPKGSHHPVEIIDGVKAFCNGQQKKFAIVEYASKIIPVKGEVYITLTENELATLVKKIRDTKLQLGKDIGILSFNETILKELLGITVVSTDFSAMGKIAAEMILNKDHGNIRNTFSFIKRESL